MIIVVVVVVVVVVHDSHAHKFPYCT